MIRNFDHKQVFVHSRSFYQQHFHVNVSNVHQNLHHVHHNDAKLIGVNSNKKNDKTKKMVQLNQNQLLISVGYLMLRMLNVHHLLIDDCNKELLLVLRIVINDWGNCVNKATIIKVFLN